MTFAAKARAWFELYPAIVHPAIVLRTSELIAALCHEAEAIANTFPWYVRSKARRDAWAHLSARYPPALLARREVVTAAARGVRTVMQ